MLNDWLLLEMLVGSCFEWLVFFALYDSRVAFYIARFTSLLYFIVQKFGHTYMLLMAEQFAARQRWVGVDKHGAEADLPLTCSLVLAVCRISIVFVNLLLSDRPPRRPTEIYRSTHQRLVPPVARGGRLALDSFSMGCLSGSIYVLALRFPSIYSVAE